MASRSHTSDQDLLAQRNVSSNVVLTGMGVVSPIGIGNEAYWQSMVEQRSGIDALPPMADWKLPAFMGGAIKEFEPKQYVKPRKVLKVMCREIQVGFTAARLAVEQAQIDPSHTAPERLGVVFGSEMMYCDPSEMEDVYGNCLEDGKFHAERWGDVAMAKMYPLWMLMYLPNMTACHIGIANDARGPNNTICQGDISSQLALIEAASIIARGQADVMITGGSSSRLSVTTMLYHGTDHLSSRVDCPAQACRPFDATRDGTVHGEGAAAFVLESEEHAVARGAPILARICSWGLSFGDQPTGDRSKRHAIRRSIEKSLERAALQPADVGHVNAHAGGLRDDDAIEAAAIAQVLGDVPVTAPKSFFGTIGSAGGAVEMAASLLALQHGQVPVTLNYSNPDPDCPVRVVHDEPMVARHPTAIVVSRANTGQVATLVLGQ